MTKTRGGRSPWAWRPPAPTAVVSPPVVPPDADVVVPGSKSGTNRALLIAALAEGTSRLRGVLRSDDSYWATKALQDLGVRIRPGEVRWSIEGAAGRWPVRKGELFVGSAGTLARFLPGALAAAPRGWGRWTVDGSDQLRARPVGPLVAALRSLGADAVGAGGSEGDGGLPLQVGAGLTGGEAVIPGDVSSQYASGVLLAAPYAERPVTVRVTGDLVQPDYIRMTTAMMEAFGVKADEGPPGVFSVRPGLYRGRDYTVEADASTAGYFLALAALTRGRIRVTNVGYDSLQPDARFVDVLARLGARVTKGPGWLEVKGPERLRGGLRVDMRAMSDQTLTLGALAVYADGPVEVTGVEHIRRHESDRLRVFCQQMARLGVRTEERADGFVVHPGRPRVGATLDPHDDHRHAMAFALLGARTPGVRIADPGCASKTCPAYFDMLAQLGVVVDYE